MGLTKMNDQAGNKNIWSEEGYVVGIPYAKLFHRLQSPVNMVYAAAVNGYPVPDINAAFRYCDLGCGEGITILTMAAAYPNAEFVGIDIIPEHIQSARVMAEAAGLTNITFYESDFADVAQLGIGTFEFIAAQGLLSWVDSDVLHRARDAVDMLLAPGGLFYAAYVSRGRSSSRIEGTRKLIHSYIASSTSTSLEDSFYEALDKIGQMAKSHPGLFGDHIELEKAISTAKMAEFRYIAHDYCTKNFASFYFVEMAQFLAKIGLSFAGTPTLQQNEPRNKLPKDQQYLIDGLSRLEAENRASLLADENFRWDIFRRPYTDEREAQSPKLGGGVLLAPERDPFVVDCKIKIFNRVTLLDRDILVPMANLVAGGTHNCESILKDPSLAVFDPALVEKTLRDIIAVGFVTPTMTPPVVMSVEPSRKFRFVSGLSAPLCDRDFPSHRGIFFPSEVTGNGVHVTGFSCFALRALHGRTLRDALETAIEQIFQLSEKDILEVSGVNLKKPESRRTAVDRFISRTLPAMIKYRVIEPIPEG